MTHAGYDALVQPGTNARTRIGGSALPLGLVPEAWTATTCGTCWASACTFDEVASGVPEGFLYDGQLRPVAWLNGAGQVYATFVYGLHVNVPEYMTTVAGTYRILTDHLGSPRVVVDTTTGAVAQRMDYDAWGQVLADTNPGFQPFGFAGGLWDRDSGLVRFGARDYDPQVGRWTSKDALGLEGGINVYEYADSAPSAATDPTGLLPQDGASTDRFIEGQAVLGPACAGGDESACRLIEIQATAFAVAALEVAGPAVVVPACGAAKAIWKNLSFDGPGRGLRYANGRVLGVRWKRLPLVRLDLHPLPESEGRPVLHLNIGSGENKHIWIWPRKPEP